MKRNQSSSAMTGVTRAMTGVTPARKVITRTGAETDAGVQLLQAASASSPPIWRAGVSASMLFATRHAQGECERITDRQAPQKQRSSATAPAWA